MTIRFFIGLFVLFLMLSCNTSVKNESIYFGGLIKNPKSKKVEILKNNKIISTAKLDYNHNFMFKLDSLNSGLYTFKHGEEVQYIYLEPKDSLLIRLNTWDFDGSLVFSGNGANRNNYLIQLFLDNEKEERLFYDYYKLDEENFNLKIDSIFKLKKIQYKQFKQNSTKQNPDFENLIYAITNFPLYAKKEKYPLHYKEIHHLNKLPKLSVNFYRHRADNFNLYKDHYTFKDYLWNKIYNKSYYQLEKDTLNELSSILLEQITKLVKTEDEKNNMLNQTYINSLFDNSCANANKEKTKQLYFKYCTDSIKKNRVLKIIKTINTLKKGDRLPKFYLKNTEKKLISSIKASTNNTVIYFWPKEKNRIKNMAKRINFLIKKYPNINFIGIDGQLNADNWKAFIQNNKLDIAKQFQLVAQNKNTFYTNDFPRAVIIKDGIIQNNFTIVSQYNFEQLLVSIYKN